MVRDALLNYGAPFIGALLLSVGIAGGVMGGYGAVQKDADLCGNPLIMVATTEETQDRLRGYESGGPSFARIQFENLSTAEQHAFEEAITSQRGEGKVEGNLTHRKLIENGVIVEYQGEPYHTSLASNNTCLTANPLLLPLGVVSIVLGIGGVLTPPMFRRYLAFERRQQNE